MEWTKTSLTTEEAKKTDNDELLKKLAGEIRMVFLPQKPKNDFNNTGPMKFKRKKLTHY